MTIGELFDAHATFVWRTLRHFGVATVDLEDQSQEVFLIAHRRLDSWDGQHARAWLGAIARRCAAEYRRRRHRRPEEPVDTMPEATDTRDPAARVELDLLNRVLSSLDEDKRAAFFLYEVEGLSMRDVAEIVQCPIKTAYKRLYAARRELLRALGETK
jgi:RNA polymerase sigma-70 factor (ECF subfamily)